VGPYFGFIAATPSAHKNTLHGGYFLNVAGRHFGKSIAWDGGRMAEAQRGVASHEMQQIVSWSHYTSMRCAKKSDVCEFRK